jgi:hypothetical protein
VYFRSKPIGWDTSALFQNQSSVALDARFRWLTNRGVALYPEDSSTSIQSLGTNATPLSQQPQWCTNGNPQDTTQYTASIPCLQASCDQLGSSVAYQWNSSILVARFARSHFYTGGSQPVCRGYDTPVETQGGCCAVTDQTNGSKTLVECPFEDSNICFARFINRPYQWNDSAVPFSMEPTKLNLVDRNSICCEYPHPLQSVCDVNDSETLQGGGSADYTWVNNPDVYPEGCESDNCRETSLNRCSSGSECNSSAMAVGGGIGEVNCGATDYSVDAPLKGVAFKPGSWYYDDPFNPGWNNRPQCQENFKLNGFVGAVQQTAGGGVRRYPVGHAQTEAVRGTPFIIPAYSTSPKLQESECCSIDDRSDQRMGLVASGDNVQKYHWLSFPAISITTGP